MDPENNSLERTYFIGGPPRVGKSTLAYLLAGKNSGHAVSTDSIRNAVKKACADKTSDLFLVNKLNDLSRDEWLKIHLERPERVIEFQNKESIALWPSVISFCNSFSEDDAIHIVEGVALLPSLIHEMRNQPKHVVFIGSTDPHHIENIIKHMEQFPKKDWMSALGYDEAKVRGMANFINKMSEYFQVGAEKYGYPYYEVGASGFDKQLQKILADLI
jgi:2-phosphoglycerate kinase